ncbi:winged helix-turn-helix domain-containing protein [Pelomonas sp. KK5]|uniref:winged helix-turn-helix domain-containing protein n=1 Tax=Pelomonas sp. KK5 TaxID=1855730 RepID=UPI00097C9647|nr:response regulator transcription factor [Pelomonas sp. KK5]
MTAVDLGPTQLLLIEPDPAACRILAAALTRWGHLVTLGDLQALENRRLLARAEMLLIDPSGAGFGALRLLRWQQPRLPVIAMLAGDESLDRVLALESGADAVIAKPVDVRELKLRMHGLLSRRPEARADALSFGRWRLDPATRRLEGPGGFGAPLSPAEYRVLRAFLERPRSVLRRQELLELARDGGEALERSVDLLVSRLRSKLDDDARDPRFIRTVRGVGYLFDDSWQR